MKKIIALLVLAILSLSLCLPFVAAVPEPTVAPLFPTWAVVVRVASGVLILISGIGILSFYASTVGKPPPAFGHSLSDDELNMDNTPYLKSLLTSVICGHMATTGHNYSG